MASEVKYTAEQVEALKAAVAEGQTVEQMALAMGKGVRSVVAKLTQLGLYQAKARVKAETRVTKAQMLMALEQRLELAVGTLASLEKADKAALEALVAAVGDQAL